MKSFAAILALAALASAAAVDLEKRFPLCASGTPLCCETDVLGVADLDCVSPPNNPLTVSAFQAECAKTGTTAECCALSLGGLASLVCNKPAA